MISIRDLQPSDVPNITDYWFRSPPGFIEAMGVDRSKFPSEHDFIASLESKICSSRSAPQPTAGVLAIVRDEDLVGFHTLNPIEKGDHGVFHAHIIRSKFRGQGICMTSYPLACHKFIHRFDLKRILFKTPIQNIGAIRVKEKLGIPSIGNETISFGIMKDETPSQVFELSRARAEQLYSAVSQ